MIRSICAIVVLFAAAACAPSPDRPGAAGARGAIDTQEPQREAAVTLPPYPQDGNLLEFTFGPAGSHRYFIDTQSLHVSADGIVRYAIVVNAAGGATNVSFEGIRCQGAQKRVYALGRGGNQWIEAKRSDWSPIRFTQPNEYQAGLYADAFCPGRVAVRSREEALKALRSGSRGRVSPE